jgi:hypothetical protein
MYLLLNIHHFAVIIITLVQEPVGLGELFLLLVKQGDDLVLIDEVLVDWSLGIDVLSLITVIAFVSHFFQLLFIVEKVLILKLLAFWRLANLVVVRLPCFDLSSRARDHSPGTIFLPRS